MIFTAPFPFSLAASCWFMFEHEFWNWGLLSFPLFEASWHHRRFTCIGWSNRNKCFAVSNFSFFFLSLIGISTTAHSDHSSRQSRIKAILNFMIRPRIMKLRSAWMESSAFHFFFYCYAIAVANEVNRNVKIVHSSSSDALHSWDVRLSGKLRKKSLTTQFADILLLRRISSALMQSWRVSSHHVYEINLKRFFS